MISRVQSYGLIAGCLLAIVVATLGVGRWAYVQALAQLTEQTETDLALARDRISARLQRYQDTAVMLSLRNDLVDGPRAERAAALQAIADRISAIDISYFDPQGRPIISTSKQGPVVAAFNRAQFGGLGRAFETRNASGAPVYDGSDGTRIYAVAVPVFRDNGAVGGVVQVLGGLARLELDWIGQGPALYFADARGAVRIANRNELLSVDANAPMPRLSWLSAHGSAVHRTDWDGMPRYALRIAQPVPLLDLEVVALADVEQPLKLAILQAGAFLSLCLLFCTLLYMTGARRRMLARLNARLEARVGARTKALVASNKRLQHEVSERREAEDALRRAQAELVQAAKLSALGEMSAGISHELNQPLMAAQSFAENGATFLKAGRIEAAQANFEHVRELTGRMGRIIKNLRAFARNEHEPAGRVDMVKVIDTALDLADARIGAADVLVDWRPPDDPIWVHGGEVRLGQVVLNLITNAVDAMRGTPQRELAISVSDKGTRVVVAVADTGPGIKEPEKIFDPFYSTKEVGPAEGVGLGLSISYGLVQNFGGEIKGRNRPTGGAVFTIELAPG